MSLFKFKQFHIDQSNCAMKIGTDGVLLGAWASTTLPKKILDIGTGTGIISLMLAQRYPMAEIQAIEIENNAFKQAINNFNQSPWSNKISIVNQDFQNFNSKEKYDLIVSNPPFHNSAKGIESSQRIMARHEDSLPLKNLLVGMEKNLSINGKACLVLPYDQWNRVNSICAEIGLFLNKVCLIKGNKNAKVKRMLLELSFQKQTCRVNYLVLEKTRHNYTEEYIDLVKDFFLKM